MPEEAYLFCDLETTGLDARDCSITEIACILTHGPSTGFEEIDDYHALISGDRLWQRGAFEMAQESGLIEELDEKPTFSPGQVEAGVAQMIARFDRVYLAARNTAFERSFLREHLPGLEKCLHYREYDVTALTLTDPDLKDYDPDVDGEPHRAEYDIRRDLELAREFVRRHNE